MDRPLVATERATLEAMLDVQRAGLVQLLDDVDEAAARARLVPSRTTLLSLVTHATFVERVWFHARVEGASRVALGLPDDADDSFLLRPGDTVDAVREAFLSACERSRQIAAGHQLDEQFPWYDDQVSLRFVFVHVIAEHARHAGHGDILREQLAARVL